MILRWMILIVLPMVVLQWLCRQIVKQWSDISIKGTVQLLLHVDGFTMNRHKHGTINAMRFLKVLKADKLGVFLLMENWP